MISKKKQVNAAAAVIVLVIFSLARTRGRQPATPEPHVVLLSSICGSLKLASVCNDTQFNALTTGEDHFFF